MGIVRVHVRVVGQEVVQGREVQNAILGGGEVRVRSQAIWLRRGRGVHTDDSDVDRGSGLDDVVAPFGGGTAPGMIYQIR